MTMNTRITNMGPKKAEAKPGTTQIDTRTLERLHASNARLTQQMLAAQKSCSFAQAEKQLSAEQLKFVNEELANANRTICDLQRQIRDLTESLAEALSKPAKKDRKSEPKKTEITDGDIKISVN